MGTIYYPDGRKEERAPRNGHDYQLDEIHEIIGGYMEIVKCKDRRYIMVVDEEGKLKNKPRNEAATLLADLPTPESVERMQLRARKLGIQFQVIGTVEQLGWIAGTALYCRSEEVE